MNLYTTLDSVKDRLGITATGDDSIFLDSIEEASRVLDAFCDRFFYSETGSRDYDAFRRQNILIDDLLSATSLTLDTEQDGVFDDETWTEGTEYFFRPLNVFPKQRVDVTTYATTDFSRLPKSVRIAGIFGFGNGKIAAPWEATAITVTVANTTLTALTLSADDVIQPGHTILCGTEQMYISAVSAGAATAERGVNGTTAAAQAAAVASLALYPKSIIMAARVLATTIYNEREQSGMKRERIGDYSYERAATTLNESMTQMVGPFRRLTA